MVGREAELAVLSGTFDSVAAHRLCRMVTLIGDAGVGKTRLTQEFVDSVATSARIVRGRCLPYGDGITFWPIVEVVRGAAGIGEADTGEQAREKLRALVGDDEIAERVGAAIGLVDAPFQVPSCSGASGGSWKCSPWSDRSRSSSTTSTGPRRRSWS